MDEDLTLRVNLDDDASPGVKRLRDDVQGLGRDVDTSGRRASSAAGGWDKYGRVAKRALLGVATAAGAAAYGIARLLKSSLDEASTLNESLNAVSVTYGKQTKAVLGLSRAAAKGLGLSRTEFNSLSVRFSAFAKTVGGGGKSTVKTLDDLTTRASDFASVMNLEVAESAELFQSGLAGETEPLRKYGIDLSAAKVQAYAYAEGIAKTGAELTETEKVQARYGSLMEQTQQTHKDFANTSGELANQQRILGARFDNSKAKLGTALLPVAKDVVRFLNREGIPAFGRFSDWFTEKGIPLFGEFVEDARPLVDELLPAMGSAFGTIRDMLGAAAPYAKDLIGAFNDAPDWVQAALTGGAVGGIAAKKFGLGKALGVGADLISKAKPLPVFVVNNGGGVGGGGGLGPDGKPAKPGAHRGGRSPGSKAARGFGAATGLALGYEALFGDAFGLIPADKPADPAPSRRVGAGAFGIGAIGKAVKAERDDVQRSYGLIVDDVKNTSAAVADLNRQIGAGRDRLGLYGTGLGVIADKAQAADSRLQSMRETLLNMPAAGSYGNGLGVYAPGAVAGGPASTGGRGNKAGGKATSSSSSTVFGGKPASPLRAAPLSPRPAMAGGGVTIAENAIPINVNNPASNVDVVTAVHEGIRGWLAEREER